MSLTGALTAPSYLGESNLLGLRALGALTDLELDLLTAGEAIEIRGALQLVAMEEVFLAIFRGDETEATIRDELLDGTGGHVTSLGIPNEHREYARSVREAIDHAGVLRLAAVTPYHGQRIRAV
jgi:hypothetical protein